MEQEFVWVDDRSAVRKAYEKTGKEIEIFKLDGWKVEFEPPYRANPRHLCGVVVSPDGAHKYDFDGFLLDEHGGSVNTAYGRKYWPEPWAASPEDSVAASRLVHLVIYNDSLRKFVESPKRAA